MCQRGGLSAERDWGWAEGGWTIDGSIVDTIA